MLVKGAWMRRVPRVGDVRSSREVSVLTVPCEVGVVAYGEGCLYPTAVVCQHLLV